MQSRPPGRRRRIGRFVSPFLATTPIPAFAADLALSPWSTYLFFAIVATVVIVLLLHEALDNDQNDARRGHDRSGEAFGAMQTTRSRFGHESVAGNDGDARAA